ncbi:MAG: EpsI family protein [Nitrospiraceae bacterium]|nr:MAG: EpsI family protein [Nitrospiraceae bacterium]
MKSSKFIIAGIILILSIVLSYTVPKAKYRGTGFISTLDIPKSFGGWSGKDVTAQAGLNLNSDMYGFVSEALVYQYINEEGKSLLFIILDAGNFHHPKVCFTGAGYSIKELPDTTFRSDNVNFKAHTLFTERGRETALSFYWIVIDKNIAHEWVEQKIKQLFFSLFGTQRVGLMVRIDIPGQEADQESAAMLAGDFINNLDIFLDKHNADYIFGNK